MPEPHPFPDEFSPVGSGVFYAIRFAPLDRQSTLSLANAFYRTLRNIPVTCSDPSVAAAKLDWWRQEMQRSRQSLAQHPIARSMTGLQTRYSLPEDYFEPLFQAIGQEIGSLVMENDIALENHCRVTGALFADLNALIGDSKEAQRQSARELGSYIRMVEIIRNLGADLRRNCCFIPVDRLQQHRFSPAKLLMSEDEQKVKALLSPIFTLHHERYKKTLNTISDRTGLGPVLGMAAMADSVLRRLHKAGYRRLLQQRTSLTPLQKLWISWRCQRTVR